MHLPILTLTSRSWVHMEAWLAIRTIICRLCRRILYFGTIVSSMCRSHESSSSCAIASGWRPALLLMRCTRVPSFIARYCVWRHMQHQWSQVCYLSYHQGSCLFIMCLQTEELPVQRARPRWKIYQEVLIEIPEGVDDLQPYFTWLWCYMASPQSGLTTLQHYPLWEL